MFLDSEKEMTKKEYRKLVETARKKEKDQLALILEAICATGVRVSELKYLTVKNLQYGRLEVCNKGKTRIVLIPEGLRKKLLCYAGKQGIKTGPVFVTRNGRPKDRSNIWTEMKVLAEQAGIKPKKFFRTICVISLPALFIRQQTILPHWQTFWDTAVLK